MRSLRYLNTMLTLIAILLSLTLWTQWTSSPLPDPTVSEARADGILEAGLQRQQMVQSMDLLNTKMDQLIGLLKSGQARVRIENPEQQAPANGSMPRGRTVPPTPAD